MKVDIRVISARKGPVMLRVDGKDEAFNVGERRVIDAESVEVLEMPTGAVKPQEEEVSATDTVQVESSKTLG